MFKTGNKKLSKKERAEMPAKHGIAGVLAMVHKQKRHRNKKAYDRKRVKKVSDEL